MCWFDPDECRNMCQAYGSTLEVRLSYVACINVVQSRTLGLHMWGYGALKIRINGLGVDFLFRLVVLKHIYSNEYIYMARNTVKPVHHLDCVPLTTSGAG